MRLQWILVLTAVLVLLSACTNPVAPPVAGQPTPDPSSLPVDQQAVPTIPTAEPTPERPLAAQVNGQPIYLVDYERQVAQYQEAMASSGIDLVSEEGQQRLLQAREQILNWMVEQVLVEQAAASMGIVVTDEQIEAELTSLLEDVGGEEAFQARLEQNDMTLQDVRTELRAQLIGAAVVEQVTAAVPTTAEHVHARHILVDTQEEAERLLAQLQAGADFAELARTYSQDESTRAAGGDLGFFPHGVLLAPEVDEAAFALQPGQISGVVASSFGYHIVQVIEREPERTLSPDNLQLLREQAFSDWIGNLWAQAIVERYVNSTP